MADDLEPYKTSDTPLAAYLHMKGMVVLTTRTDPNDSKREIYVFLDEPLRPQYEEEFQQNVGGYRRYYSSIREMKGLIVEARRRQYDGNR